MGLADGLTLNCYTLPTSGTPVVRAYKAEVDSLTFSHIAPGGYGTLTARIALPSATLPQPQLQLFARVALMSRGAGPQNNGNAYARFVGEIMDSKLGLDKRGAYVTITALGIGNWMRDDPFTKAYTTQTVQQIANDQLSIRHVWYPISSDTSAIFPTNPGATYTVSYTRRTMEEVLQDICTLAGDYQWGTWAHPLQTDAAGFPLGQLFIHARDTTTTRYSASVKQGDVETFEVSQSADRAYNHIELDYATSAGVQTLKYSDSRLSGGVAQGTAPFRFRSMVRDYTGNATIGLSQATSIAATYGAQMQNVSNKVTLTLRRLRDAAGNLIPLDAAQADANISLPELAVRGQQLATSPTAGVNQFYIYRATYSADNAGNQLLTLECDNYADRAATQVARLQARADAISRYGNTLQNAAIQQQGLPLTVKWAFSESNCLNGDTVGPVILYPLRLYQPATSHTFSASASGAISSGPFSNDFTIYGANAWCVSSGGHSTWTGTATTVGNCLYEIHHEQGRVTWHCDGCDTLHRGLLIAEHVMVSIPRYDGAAGERPGLSAYSIKCPTPGCGGVESFNTGLHAYEEDESHPGNYARRAEQARLIRQLQQHQLVGLRAHPAV